MLKVRDIDLDDFPRFQHEPYRGRVGVSDNTPNPRTKEFKLNEKKYKNLIKVLDKYINKSKLSKSVSYRATKVYDEITNIKLYTDTCNFVRYTNNEYCVSYDNAFLLEEAGVSTASLQYQIIYKTDELLAEMLAACVGSNAENLKKRLIENLSHNNKSYKEYCNELIGKYCDRENNYITTKYLFNTSTFLDSFFIDLKDRIWRKTYFYHGKRWNKYTEEEYDDVFNKAIICNVMDVQQFVMDNMMSEVIEFIHENTDAIGGITSIGRGGFVLQSNKMLEFPEFRLKGIHGEVICEIKPKIYSGVEFINEYIATIT